MMLNHLMYKFDYWKTPQQEIPHDSKYHYYINLSGRGSGKSKTASEEARKRALANPGTKITIVAPTLGAARNVNIEGESGILAVCGPGEVYNYLKNNGQIIFNNGSKILTFSAQEPERIRGIESHYAFLDEFAAYGENAEEVLQQIEMSNRLGTDPKIFITTTPKPLPVLLKLIQHPRAHVVVNGTLDNPFLATPQLRELVNTYANTSIGAQELFGQILKEAKNAQWTREMIEDHRVKESDCPKFTRTIVAIDPARTKSKRSDEAGIIVASLGTDGHIYIRRDLSRKASPAEWAKIGIAAYKEYQANLLCVERSEGTMAKDLIRAIDPHIPVRLLRHMRKGKDVRAEPASALYEQGKVHHVGYFPLLEDQLTSKVPGDDSTPDDRHDALVYAVKELSASAQGGRVVTSRPRTDKIKSQMRAQRR